ncbi:MAG TPA: hypothetical protein VN213_15015, partial [Solirubrobacteraceae bacterium]|nr:hypothetical protein [Solirubrobacteraceae bacterium]
PGPGQVPVAGEDGGDLVIGMMGGEAPDQLDGVFGQPAALGPARVEPHGQRGARAAFPLQLDVSYEPELHDQR